MHILKRRQVHILAGASGSGKSTLLLQCIRDKRRGVDAPIGFAGDRIAYAVMDRAADDLRDRALRWHLQVPMYSLCDDPVIAEKDFIMLYKPNLLMNRVMECFKRNSTDELPFDVLVLDPIILLMEGSTNDYRDVARSLIRLGWYAAMNNITILATHHATKAKTETGFMRAQDRILGSAAFQGYSGTQMILIDGPEQSSSNTSLHLIPHTAPPERHDFVWTGAKEDNTGELKKVNILLEDGTKPKVKFKKGDLIDYMVHDLNRSESSVYGYYKEMKDQHYRAKEDK